MAQENDIGFLDSNRGRSVAHFGIQNVEVIGVFGHFESTSGVDTGRAIFYWCDVERLRVGSPVSIRLRDMDY